MNILKIEQTRVYKWENEIKKWFDITKFYDEDISKLIKKN